MASELSINKVVCRHHGGTDQEKLHNFEVAMQTQLLEVKSHYENNLIYELSAGNTLNIYKYISHVIPETLFQASSFTLFPHSNFELPATNTLSAKGPTLSCITLSEEGVYLTLCSLGSSKPLGQMALAQILKSYSGSLYATSPSVYIKS